MENLDEVQWRSPEWIQAHQGLRTDNVLDYFAESPFYDRVSNNQVLRMQTQFNQQQTGQLTPQHFEQELQKMTGIEFVITHVREPDLWVIKKQNRLNPQQTTPISTYFVINENVYMAPTVAAIMQSRVLSTSMFLKRALEEAIELPSYSPSQGYTYEDSQLAAGAAGADEDAAPQATKAELGLLERSFRAAISGQQKYVSDIAPISSQSDSAASSVPGTPVLKGRKLPLKK